ncbi:hypothetical protein Nmel_010130 [Mimus melanotis]
MKVKDSTEENTLHKELLTSLLILVLVVIIFVVLVGYFFRFRRHRKAVVTSGDKKMPNGILEEQEQQRVMLLSRSPSGPKKYFPIPVENLEEEIRIRSADEGKLFREEFNSLTSGYVQGTFEMANKEENREKNRYPNILPCKPFAFLLNQTGYKEKNKFIAAQGPKQETVNDFWRMIWEQKSAIIVMLTNLKERKEGCWTYGSVRVSVEDCIVLVDYTIRKFCVHSMSLRLWLSLQLHEGCKAPRLVTQLHFTSWPDFGVPFTPIGMLKFLKKVKTLNPAHAGPIVVHCRYEKCCQYWPSEGSVTHGDITVEIKSDSLVDAISVRDFLVTFNQSTQERQSRLVRQFHFHGWPEIGIPAEGKGMIDLIAAVQKQQQQTGNHPITVHCSAGAGRTGTFIALSNILERVKAEGLLDVFQAVKSLRLQRPHMVQTLEQYEFCYRVVQDFIDIFSDYANFK